VAVYTTIIFDWRMRIMLKRVTINSTPTSIMGPSMAIVTVISSGCSAGNTGYLKEISVLVERVPEKECLNL